MTPLEAFEKLAAGWQPKLAWEVSRHITDHETVMRVLFVGERVAMSAALWTRPHVGGLADFEVVDTDGNMRFWQHLEGADASEIERVWHAMIEAYVAAESAGYAI